MPHFDAEYRYNHALITPTTASCLRDRGEHVTPCTAPVELAVPTRGLGGGSRAFSAHCPPNAVDHQDEAGRRRCVVQADMTSTIDIESTQRRANGGFMRCAAQPRHVVNERRMIFEGDAVVVDENIRNNDHKISQEAPKRRGGVRPVFSFSEVGL